MPELIRSVVSRMRIYVKDRRRSPRLRVRLLFSATVCRSPNGNGMRARERTLKGHTRDIGANGLGLNVPHIHLDGHHLATAGNELEVTLELPGGPMVIRVVPRRYERLDDPELGCAYLVGVQITHMDVEDRRRYLSFIASSLSAPSAVVGG